MKPTYRVVINKTPTDSVAFITADEKEALRFAAEYAHKVTWTPIGESAFAFSVGPVAV